MAKKDKKHTYKFNPHTLSYEKVIVGARDRLKKVSFTVVFGLVLGVLFAFIGFQVIDSPKERALKREIAQYKRHLKSLDERVSRAEDVLKDLEQRDDNIYRTIFEVEPISSNVRNSGIGGVERYREFQGYDCSEVLTHTTRKVDELSKRLYVESHSLDEIYDMARNKQKRMAAMPAIMPVAKNKCRLVSGFGMRFHPILHYRRMHTGIDLAAPKGTPIYATGDGVIKKADWESGYGKIIIINHGFGYETWYAHLNDYDVRVGQKVKRGEVIGKVGNTGKSTGPHLHYEVRLKGKVVNPVNYYFMDLSAEDYDKMIELAANQGKVFD